MMQLRFTKNFGGIAQDAEQWVWQYTQLRLKQINHCFTN